MWKWVIVAVVVAGCGGQARRDNAKLRAELSQSQKAAYSESQRSKLLAESLVHAEQEAARLKASNRELAIKVANPSIAGLTECKASLSRCYTQRYTAPPKPPPAASESTTLSGCRVADSECRLHPSTTDSDCSMRNIRCLGGRLDPLPDIPTGGWWCISNKFGDLNSTCFNSGAMCKAKRKTFEQTGSYTTCSHQTHAACYQVRNHLDGEVWRACSKTLADCDSKRKVARMQKRDFKVISKCEGVTH